VQQADDRAETKHGLEENRLDKHVPQALPDYTPVWLALPAGDVPDNPHHTAIGVVQRNENEQRKEDFFYKGKHTSSILG
jgi:hypothetical protein